MVALKVSEFDAADPLDGSELVGIVQDTENRQTTTADVAALAIGDAATIELIRDTIGTTIVGGQGINSVVDDAGNTVTLNAVPDVQAVVSNASVTPTFNDDAVKITALAANVTINNPTGTAVDMKGLVIRIKDNGTSRTITFGAQFRAVGVTLPTATTISKTLYIGAIYNSEDTKWDVVTVKLEA